MRELKLKEQRTTRSRWANLNFSGRDAKTNLSVDDEWSSLTIRLTNRQLRSIRNWINKKLGDN
jgi:hypothetical protein